MESKKFKKMGDEMVKEAIGLRGVAGDGNLYKPEVASRKQSVDEVDEQMLRSIFPEETWILILTKLGPEEKANCAIASSYFRKLLRKERAVYLFPKVIEVMALLFEGKAWKAAVLNLRLVCSAYNKVVENCYEKPEMTGIPEFMDDLDPRSKLNNLRNIAWTKQQIPFDFLRQLGRRRLHVLEHFEQSHHSGVGAPPKNPFIGRYVQIRLDMPYPNYRPLEDITEILKKFGKEIWYLELEITPDLSIPGVHLVVFRKLRGIMLLVPNLKFLQITSTGPIPHVSSKSGKHPNIIDCSPLPKFEKLEILSVNNLGAQIGSEVIRKNHHVRFLKISDMDEADEDIENSLEMANLQGLSVMDSPSGTKMLQRVGSTWKVLKKLYYGNFRRRNGTVLPPIGMGAPQAFEIFQRNWASTLTELHLEHPFGFDDVTISRESKALRLNLPGVRKLTLCVFHFYLFLDFALPLKNSLEHLALLQVYRYQEISKWHRVRVKSKQEIQLAGFEERMEMSNIWQFFRKLETIKVQKTENVGCNVRLFTREEFEEYKFN